MSGMPAFHRGWVHQIHAHELGLFRDVEQTRLDFTAVIARHAQDADDHFRRILDLGKTHRCGLEEIRGEQGAQHGVDLIAGVEVRLLQDVNGFHILGRRQAPGRHRHFVGDEEVVQVPGEEPRGGGLFADEVDNILAVPATGLTQEGLLTLVVVRRVIAELPRAAAVGEGRVSWGIVPASKRPGARFNVVFGVVERFVFANTEGEQLQQLSAIVLVDGDLVAFSIVQIVHHGRAGGQAHQQVTEVAHAVLPEHTDHSDHLLPAVDLTVPGAEDHVPEEAHLLLELAGVVDHPVDPLLDIRLDIGRMVIDRIVTQHEVVLEGRLRCGIKQFLYHSVIALSRFGFNLSPARPKTSTAQEMPHQSNVFLVSHTYLLTR